MPTMGGTTFEALCHQKPYYTFMQRLARIYGQCGEDTCYEFGDAELTSKPFLLLAARTSPPVYVRMELKNMGLGSSDVSSP